MLRDNEECFPIIPTSFDCISVYKDIKDKENMPKDKAKGRINLSNIPNSCFQYNKTACAT
jgi:hypothetical protein